MSSQENLKQQIIPKNKEFFEGLYRDYYSSLVMFCEGILFDTDEAKDVVQEAFIDLWNKKESIQVETSIKTYLYSCVKYKAFSRIKRLNIIDKHENQLKEAYLFAHEYDSLPSDELKDKIHQTISSLPCQMRKILEFHSFHGWKYQEIADELEISVNSVKTQIKRAYKRFRDEIGSDYKHLVMIWFIVGMCFY